MMEIFHVLPLAAALLLFILLATDGQFREIYIALLEGPNHNTTAWWAGLVAAAAVFAFISAILCEAHYSLSTMRINVVYSSYSDPDANSKLRNLQRTAAFILAFFPWLGITVGILNARNFIANRYCQLLTQMSADALNDMQHLLVPDGGTIAGAVIFLGGAIAVFSCVDQKARIAQRAIAIIAPSLMILLFLLFTDWLTVSISDRWAVIFGGVTCAATVGYFLVYRRLYQRRGGFVFSRLRTSTAGGSALAPDIDFIDRLSQYHLDWILPLLSPFLSRSEFATGVSLRKRQRQMLFVWAFLPWFFLALYFLLIPYIAPGLQSAGPTSVAQCPVAATRIPVPGRWAVFPVAMCCTIAVGLLIGLLLNRFSEHWKVRRITIVSLLAFLVLAAKMISWLEPDTIVIVYRFIGPLGTVGLQLLFLISTFALLAWLSQRSGFPALTLVILAIVICVMFPNYVGWTTLALGIVCVFFAIAAFLSGLVAVGSVALVLPILGAIQWSQLHATDKTVQNVVDTPAGTVDPLTVKFQFECWLGQRGIAVNDPNAADQLRQTCPAKAQLPNATSTGASTSPYPVFLVAAEGGGIYAASAASMFLARLEKYSPEFAEHVFAISGVSGGAIGSTVFQALDKSAQTVQAPTNEPLTEKVTEIMEDDHFSPVVGSIFPEIMGASTGRAETLVASFEASTATRDAVAGKELSAPFGLHWTYRNFAPALVLNATWVETGFRVAFAPFHLHDIDESLYSFSDASMPDESCPQLAENHSCISLMAAAAVSARFPLVLPPFSVELLDGRRWNFVDGGYSDNSGATTALDLYRVLKEIAPSNVDLQIILITSSNPQPNLTGTEINGTVFRDTIAPIDALMKVRSDLGTDAVARACSEIYPNPDTQESSTRAASSKKTHARNEPKESNATCIDHAGDPTQPLQIVEIQDQTYGLALGWKISQTSFAVVSWMLGDPNTCPTKSPPTTASTDPPSDDNATQQTDNAKLNNAIVRRNSCVMKSILDLVQAAPTFAATTPSSHITGQ